MFNIQTWRTPAQQFGSVSGLNQEKMDLKDVVFAVKRLNPSWYSGGTIKHFGYQLLNYQWLVTWCVQKVVTFKMYKKVLFLQHAVVQHTAGSVQTQSEPPSVDEPEERSVDHWLVLILKLVLSVDAETFNTEVAVNIRMWCHAFPLCSAQRRRRRTINRKSKMELERGTDTSASQSVWWAVRVGVGVSGIEPATSQVRDAASQLFGLLIPPQQADVQTQERVSHAHWAVHRRHQQGEEGQLLLPRRQREDDLTGRRHDDQSQQVDGLQRMEQRNRTAEERVSNLITERSDDSAKHSG